MEQYSVSIKWSDEDEGFIATVPELEGLSAFGITQGEALAELDVAADAYLKSWRASGRPLPSPEKVPSYSGQLRLRMPKDLHAGMAKSAHNQGVSLNTYLVSLLSQRQGEIEALALFKAGLKSWVSTIQHVPDKIVSKGPADELRAPAGAVKEKKREY